MVQALSPPPQLLTAEEADYFRRRPRAWLEACRRSPTLFIAHVLGVTPAELHVDLQKFLLEHSEPGGDCLVLLPRNHGKTTQLTVGLTCWEIGQPEGGMIPQGGTNLRFQIVQSAIGESKKTVRACKSVLESDRYREVFPWVEPSKDEWGVTALTVKRTKVGLRDPTISAQAINGAAGQRADRLIPDDIEDFDNSIRQPAMREQVKDAWVNTWVPTLEPETGVTRRVATPWHVDGIVMDWMRRAENGKPRGGRLEDSRTLPCFKRPCIGTESSPWPTRWTPKLLRAKRLDMGGPAYDRAYGLLPVTGDEVLFAERDLMAAAGPLPEKLVGAVRWAAFDFAFSADELGLKGARKGKRDFAVMAVADISRAGHVHSVYCLRVRTTYPKFEEMVVGTAQRLGVRWAKAETGAWQVPVAQSIKRALAKLGIATKGQIRDRDKPVRAAGVQAVVESGRFHLRTDAGGNLLDDQRVMFDELRMFPLGAHDDTVDAAIDLMEEAHPLLVQDLERRDPRSIEAIEEANEGGSDDPPWAADEDE